MMSSFKQRHRLVDAVILYFQHFYTAKKSESVPYHKHNIPILTVLVKKIEI